MDLNAPNLKLIRASQMMLAALTIQSDGQLSYDFPRLIAAREAAEHALNEVRKYQHEHIASLAEDVRTKRATAKSDMAPHRHTRYTTPHPTVTPTPGDYPPHAFS